MKQPDLNKIVRKIRDLPTLPRTVLRITEIINNPRSSAKDLASVITEDQILTARLLKLVNSAFYGFPQQISTVTNAVVLLGFDAIRNLLLTTSVFDIFIKKQKVDKEKLEKFWDHSLSCAVGAKVIGSYLRYEKVEELFVAGLLHDIGKVIEMLYMPEAFEQIEQIVNNENILIRQAEEEVLGFTHTEIGELLAKKWGMPDKLAKAIAFHHQPEMADGHLFEAGVVHLSDILTRALNAGSGGDNRIPSLDPIAWGHIKLSVGAIEQIMREMDREFSEISKHIKPIE